MRRNVLARGIARCLPWIVAAACGAGAAPAATAPEAPVAPGAPAGASQADASAAYDAKQWARCAQLYEAVAGRATGRARENALYNAACCHALDGRADAAFAALERTIEAGLRDTANLEADTDLASLHGDPRWPRLVAGAKARTAQWEATLGDPALRRELLALMDEDQVARKAMIANSKDPAAKAAVEASDRKTTARMKEIVAKHGWPGHRLIGEDGANAAWLLVQHADAELAFQKQCLALMKPLVDAGDVAPRHYAYLYDRVAVAEQRPQRWGTQFGPDGEPQPIEDAAHVDERRKAVGLGTMAEYRQDMRRMYGPPAASPAAPPTAPR
jgi:hypothetical protein